MKLNVLLWLVALLATVLPRSADCRPSVGPAARRPLLPLPRQLLLRLGEEFSLRLGGAPYPGNRGMEEEGGGDKEKRSEEPPISLDLTFHLLREVLEMARAEQMAQQADSNRKMMDDLGK